MAIGRQNRHQYLLITSALPSKSTIFLTVNIVTITITITITVRTLASPHLSFGI
jgi:hypothetical protein